MEPPTTAKVILHTTKGPIEIELWAKETPLASRNFIQLCVNGYFDNCMFHRVVKDFIVQAGDPSGTGYGGSAIYDNGTFKDEFHSRLKFGRRGLVGCANTGTPDSNGSQFMITLVPAPELNNKNTLFGRVEGDTFFNVLKIAEAEVDSDERPVYPTVIKSAEVVVGYFSDLEAKDADRLQPVVVREAKLKKKKPRVQLSYDEEDEEEEESVSGKVFKMKPAHDLLPDKSFVKTHKHRNDVSIAASKDKIGDPSKYETSADVPKEMLGKTNSSKKVGIQEAPETPVKSKADKSAREKQTLEMLKKFQAKLSGGSATVQEAAAKREREWSSDEEIPSDFDEDEDDDRVDIYSHKFVVPAEPGGRPRLSN
jgi:peptidyl-prolyl cis-trans isomerase SDCCAG10